ncbi:DCN1-like protein 1 isoform X2 [Gossypium hirsutum]|uniref:Defective in cullin neddylation protein n=1 Tax=Gossypium hirsutum TaxID=3635 RepID=A0ABM3BIP4_GOSHI|nr:DCN1-like protein 1 isoform X2 [Gossypium hirsutum]
MDQLENDKRELVERFMYVAGEGEKVAIEYLNLCDWDVEASIDYFYDTPVLVDDALLEALYNRYKDPDIDMILVDGITLLCNDLEVDPQDIIMLVISWHMNASTMCEYSKMEFLRGLQELSVDTVEKFRDKISYIRSELNDAKKFHDIYNFAFSWAKEKGQKSMALDTAIGMWRLLIAEKKCPLLDHWCQFLQNLQVLPLFEDLDLLLNLLRGFHSCVLHDNH